MYRSRIVIYCSGSYGTEVEAEEVEAPYRPAWVGIVRQLSIATALQYAIAGAFLISLLVPIPRSPLRGLVLIVGLASIVARILIRCPRCRARWPSSSDADGLRKPCASCGLRWGQEDNLPDGD